MTQSERRIFLIRELMKEMPQYQKMNIPQGKTEQWNLLRSLFNVGPPYPASPEFLRVQDEYLSEESKKRGVTDCRKLSPTKSDPRIFLWQGDITTLNCDAIVNAANSALLGCRQPQMESDPLLFAAFQQEYFISHRKRQPKSLWRPLPVS